MMLPILPKTYFNVGPAFFYTKLFLYNSVAICLIIIKLSHHPVPWVPQFTIRSLKDGCKELFEIFGGSSVCACFSDAVDFGHMTL